MNSDYANLNVSALAARWWMLVVRGVAAILFGVLAIVVPEISILSLIILWGAYALVDGVFNLMLAVRRARVGRSWGWLVFEGVVSVGAGVLTFVLPGMTALFLLIVIAVWAVLTGVAEIAAAIMLRRHIRGEWLLAASGVLSIAFGVLMMFFPGSGALALAWIVGGYSIVFGALLIALGLRLNRFRRTGGRQIPTGGMPTPA